MKYITLLLFSLLLLQCNGDQLPDGQKADNSEDLTTKAAPTEETSAQTVANYPSISAEKMKYLYDNCDYIDFIFYDLDFSMSQDQKPAIIQTLRGVSTTPGRIDASCKPVGRVFFQVEGVNAVEADLFFGGACLYYIFFEDGQYAYSNQMTQESASFYQQIFTQVSTQQVKE